MELLRFMYGIFILPHINVKCDTMGIIHHTPRIYMHKHCHKTLNCVRILCVNKFV